MFLTCRDWTTKTKTITMVVAEVIKSTTAGGCSRYVNNLSKGGGEVEAVNTEAKEGAASEVTMTRRSRTGLTILAKPNEEASKYFQHCYLQKDLRDPKLESTLSKSLLEPSKNCVINNFIIQNEKAAIINKENMSEGQNLEKFSQCMPHLFYGSNSKKPNLTIT